MCFLQVSKVTADKIIVINDITYKDTPAKSTVSAVKLRLQEKQRAEVEKTYQRDCENEKMVNYMLKSRENVGSKFDEDMIEPSHRTLNQTNKSPSIYDKSEKRQINNNVRQEEFSSNNNNKFNNDIVIKENDKLLKEDKETHKLEERSDSSIASSKKWDKFKSHLKRTFQTEERLSNIPTSPERPPNKVAKLDASLPIPIKNTEKEDAFKNTNVEAGKSRSKKNSSSSSNSTPSPPGSGCNSPKSEAIVLPSKHRHYHHKKALAMASSTATSNAKVAFNNNVNNERSNNQEEKVIQEKEKKNVTESSFSLPIGGTPSKPNTKKKQKSKYYKDNEISSYYLAITSFILL